ncbi:MAG: outer membrane protein assembly factor BamD [Syntrophobacterales bacterium]|nr:MAG: outer membrane protein assembly factor BamD [Syntrophobacterales bacterium]
MFTSKRMVGTVIILSLLLGGCLWKKGELKEEETSPAALYENGLALYKKKKYSRALEVFNELKGSFPGEDPYYTRAELKVADCYFFQEEYTEAISHYEEFRKFHPFNENIQYVIFQIGLSYFNQMLSADRDQSATRNALSNFEFLIANYPPSIFTDKAREKVKICRERLAEKELYIAKFHYKKKKYQGAKARLEGIVALYPDVDALDEALFYLGKSHLELGETDLARKVFTDLVGSYSDSTFSDDAKKELKELLEEEFTSTGTESTK